MADNSMTDSKYTAIKIKGLNYWLWFNSENVIEEKGIFKGIRGLGSGGYHANIEIDTGLIQGRITSDNLMYT